MGGNRQVSARARQNQDSREFSIQQTDTDSPIIPVEQLEHLHQFRPDLVNWVIEQTTKEAENRRTRQARVENYVFIERVLGIAASIVVCFGGALIGAYVALNGQPTVGGAIATAAIGTLAIAYLRRNN